MTTHAPLPERTAVLVVGAGPAGLLMSTLLSRDGIEHVIIEKRDAVNELPRARGINTRSVEILAELGLAEQLRRVSLPPRWSQNFVYTETLAGGLVGSMPGNMAPGSVEDYSPHSYRTAAQDKLDPLLLNAAASSSLATFGFGRELISLTDHGDHVEAVVKSDGGEERIHADFLIASDGGNSAVRGLLGVGLENVQSFTSFVAAHFEADLSPWIAGREGALIWTLAPGCEGVLHPLDGKTRYAAQIQYDPRQEDPTTWTDTEVITKVGTMLGIRDAHLDRIGLKRHYPYTVRTGVAERFVIGRVILLGDAAHQILPYGGMGLNTGLQSAHNLAWKLTAVLRGVAPATLLATYEAERREVALRNLSFSVANLQIVGRMMAGLRQAAGPEERSRMLADSRQYGNWTGLELGVHYDGEQGPTATVDDGSIAPSVEDAVVDYVPHARPGCRAPHFWARTTEGHRVSSIDLVLGRFTLLTGASGDAWKNASEDLPIPVMVFRVAPDGDLRPEVPEFEKLYGVGAGGAVLVRPDGHVAYRAESMLDDPRRALHQALGTILRGNAPASPAQVADRAYAAETVSVSV